MKTTMVLIVVMLFCVNCHPQQESLALGVATEATLSKDLQLYPVTANRAFLLHHRAMSRYLTLAEAIDGKKVMVSERTSDELPPPPPPPPAQSRNRLTSTASPDDFTDDETPDVNSLFIANLSADTVLIEAFGEAIQ